MKFVLPVFATIVFSLRVDAAVTIQQISAQTDVCWGAYQAHQIAESDRMTLESLSQMSLNQSQSLKMLGAAYSTQLDERGTYYLVYSELLYQYHLRCESLLPAARQKERDAWAEVVRQGEILSQMREAYSRGK